MDFIKIIETVFSVQGIRNFFTVYEDGNLSIDQIVGSVIQLLIFSTLIGVIGYFLL